MSNTKSYLISDIEVSFSIRKKVITFAIAINKISL